MNIPIKYQLKCKGYGWIEDGKIVCYNKDIPYSGSTEIGSSILWTKDKKSIGLS